MVRHFCFLGKCPKIMQLRIMRFFFKTSITLPQSYQNQFNEKLERLITLLAPYCAPIPNTYQSQATHYRQRVEFRIWHEVDKAQYAMYKPGTKELYCLDNLPAAAEPINQLMPRLLDRLNGTPELKNRLFSIEFLSTLSGQMLVTLIYHRPLEEAWNLVGEELQNEFGIQVIGRSRKQKVCLTSDFVTEQLHIDNKKYQFQQIEGSFTQPNAQINQEMINWVLTQVGQQEADLLELYCGNGNFTIPLSRRFNQVLATEISKSSIRALNWNMEANAVANLQCARLAAEEISEALKKVRPFRRLAEIDIDGYNFSHILVDPPRAGLDSKTAAFAQEFEYIVYISCNPDTLANNLQQLCNTHEVVATALFDQFPFTPHMESGVYLRKKSPLISAAALRVS